LPDLYRRKKSYYFFLKKNILVFEYQYEVSDVDQVREHLVQREFLGTKLKSIQDRYGDTSDNIETEINPLTYPNGGGCSKSWNGSVDI
jgi:hypothetical protein